MLAGLPDLLEHGNEAILIDRRSQFQERFADDLLFGLALDRQAGSVEVLHDIVAATGTVVAHIIDGAAAGHSVKEGAHRLFTLAQGLFGPLARRDVPHPTLHANLATLLVPRGAPSAGAPLGLPVASKKAKLRPGGVPGKVCLPGREHR